MSFKLGRELLYGLTKCMEYQDPVTEFRCFQCCASSLWLCHFCKGGLSDSTFAPHTALPSCID